MDGLKQHQTYARTGKANDGGDFGCGTAFTPKGGEKPPRGHMKEHERGISRPRGFHPAPDHGDFD